MRGEDARDSKTSQSDDDDFPGNEMSHSVLTLVTTFSLLTLLPQHVYGHLQNWLLHQQLHEEDS